ncbi:MAG: glycoside-pentoside-hexuronide (GPH):cation symporter [Eubacteriales bacterium]|nr:glycoside-pentoside-hexuronide (GPH):cation symporter [Eubacteriales bacterium]
MKNKKPSWKEILAFAVGDGGCNLVWTTVGSYLTLYYTDSVGLAAAAVGTMMLLTRLLDGISDLIMGSIIDRTHTRWGKARPWILWTAIPMGLGLVLMFSVPKGLSGGAQMTYAAVTYVLMAVVIYTACNLSYNTLLSLEAPDPKDRVTMSSIRFFITMSVVLFINYNCTNLVERFGWTGMSVIFGALAAILLLITFLGTKERISAPEAGGDQSKSAEKLPVLQSFRLLFQNRYFWLLALVFVINYTILGVNNGLRIYYARDVLGNAGLMGTLTLCFILPKLIGNLVYPYINRILGKWRSMMIGYVIELAGVLIMAFTQTSFATAAAGLVCLGIGGIPHNAGLFAMVADVIDYGEWKTGVRLDGLTNSVTSFGMKVGAGLGSAVVGWGLAFAAYEGALTSQGIPQAASTIAGIKTAFTMVPAALIVVGLIALFFCNLDKIYPQIRKDLDGKRTTAN